MSAASTPISAGGYLRRAFSTALGAKLLMAISGLLFYGWLVLHLAGNLAVFAGKETYNEYAHALASKPALLWGQRIGLMVVALTHIFTGVSLARRNAEARPQPYRSPRNWRQASLASRTMLLSGLVVLGFMLFHLLHFTGGVIFPEYAGRTSNGMADVHFMVTSAFSHGWVAALYVICVGCVGFHLSHAIWSATHTLGLTGPRLRPLMTTVGAVLGIGVAALFCLIPVAGAAGLLQ